MNPSLRDHFLLNPDVVFLNHGSFGACPRPVFETYQAWQRELEYQPVEFLGLSRRFPELVGEARTHLAKFLNTDMHNLAFVPNATTAINTIMRSLDLQAGDEILGTNHEYGAVDFTWEFICEKSGAKYIRHAVDLPLTTPEAFVESFWSSVTPKTKIIAISHITSPTALIFPVEEICRRAREAGIITIIDGAHVPSQLPLDLGAIGADFYTGNLHKWLCAPKGSAFLYVHPKHQELIHPLVISWGYAPDAETHRFSARHEWQGTQDISAYLSVPSAIDFQREHDWDSVRESCHALAVETRNRLTEVTGLPHIAPDAFFSQMFAVPMPEGCDVYALKARLYDEFCVELPAIIWEGKPFIRVSIQGYNTRDDADALIDALTTLLKGI